MINHVFQLVAPETDQRQVSEHLSFGEARRRPPTYLSMRGGPAVLQRLPQQGIPEKKKLPMAR